METWEAKWGLKDLERSTLKVDRSAQLAQEVLMRAKLRISFEGLALVQNQLRSSSSLGMSMNGAIRRRGAK